MFSLTHNDLQDLINWGTNTIFYEHLCCGLVSSTAFHHCLKPA